MTESEEEFQQQQPQQQVAQTLAPGSGGGGGSSSSNKLHRQMSEQPRATWARKTARDYPVKEAVTNAVNANAGTEQLNEAKPKPPQRVNKIQVGTLEVHNVKKAINR